jgi:uncharacterized membrane protein
MLASEFAMTNKPQSKKQTPQNAQSQQLVAQTYQQTRTVFDPEIVHQYSLMVPDAPERILTILEENNKVERESRMLPFKENKRRDWMGYSIVVLTLIASGFFSYIKQPIFSGGLIIIFIAVVIKTFFSKK